jgi:drug/metabolite transporter (DMT)-like permease
MLIGLTLAALAALGSGAGSAVEALGVRRAARRTRRPGDVGALLREPVYFVGLTIDLLGFAFTVLALQVLPLYLVQAVVASSVAVTAVIFAAIGRPLDRAGWVALGGSLCGLVLLGLSSQPHDVPPLAPVWYWLLLALALPIAGLGWVSMRFAGTWSAVLLALGAGLSFSCVAVAARSLDVPEPLWHVVIDPAIWAIVVNGVLGTALFALALQRGRVTVVAAVSYTTSTVVPSVVGLVFLGDEVRSGFAWVATAGFLIAVSGAIALARFTEPLPMPAPPAVPSNAANPA